MTLAELLPLLDEELGIDTSTFREDSSFVFVYDGLFEITIEAAQNKEKCLLYAPLCDVPTTRLGELYHVLLREQLFGYATHESYFGTAPERQQIILFQIICLARIQIDSFLKRLENFIDTFEIWQKKLYHYQDLLPSKPSIVKTTTPPTSEQWQIKA